MFDMDLRQLTTVKGRMENRQQRGVESLKNLLHRIQAPLTASICLALAIWNSLSIPLKRQSTSRRKMVRFKSRQRRDLALNILDKQLNAL